jgi:hypothetical protein
LSGFSSEGLLRLAASAERGSEHPLGQAVLNYARDAKVELAQPENFQAESGRGIRAIVEGKQIEIGSPRYIRELKLDTSALDEQIIRLQEQGHTAILAVVDGILAGAIGIADTVKEGSREAISVLRSLGLQVVMITGDNERTAKAIAREVGIERVLADVLPGDKANAVQKLQAEGNLSQVLFTWTKGFARVRASPIWSASVFLRSSRVPFAAKKAKVAHGHCVLDAKATVRLMPLPTVHRCVWHSWPRSFPMTLVRNVVNGWLCPHSSGLVSQENLSALSTVLWHRILVAPIWSSSCSHCFS